MDRALPSSVRGPVDLPPCIRQPRRHVRQWAGRAAGLLRGGEVVAIGCRATVFHSLVDLQAAINRFLAETNENPKPFSWTADPDNIIAAVKRGYQALDSIH